MAFCSPGGLSSRIARERAYPLDKKICSLITCIEASRLLMACDKVVHSVNPPNALTADFSPKWP